jgi:hypothetical protein
MPTPKSFLAFLLCFVVPFSVFAAESQAGYSVTYSGGSLPDVKGGESLKLHIDSDGVRLRRKSEDLIVIPAKAITEVSYAEDVHRRIGTAAGLAAVSLGAGAIVAFSKSKKHYIGITWIDGSFRGGIAFQADKNEYRGILAALEGVSGKTAVDAASPHALAAGKQPVARTDADLSSEGRNTITVHVASNPPNAEVSVDGEPWGRTPITESDRVQAGPHSIVVSEVGFEKWEGRITVAAGDDRTISAELSPSPEKAFNPRESATVAPIIVRFISIPENAEVSVDGEYWGTTPTADLPRLSAGSHTILVRKVGYESWERKITLTQGDDRTVSAELKPNDATKPRISGLD